MPVVAVGALVQVLTVVAGGNGSDGVVLLQYINPESIVGAIIFLMG